MPMPSRREFLAVDQYVVSNYKLRCFICTRSPNVAVRYDRHPSGAFILIVESAFALGIIVLFRDLAKDRPSLHRRTAVSNGDVRHADGLQDTCLLAWSGKTQLSRSSLRNKKYKREYGNE